MNSGFALGLCVGAAVLALVDYAFIRRDSQRRILIAGVALPLSILCAGWLLKTIQYANSFAPQKVFHTFGSAFCGRLDDISFYSFLAVSTLTVLAAIYVVHKWPSAPSKAIRQLFYPVAALSIVLYLLNVCVLEQPADRGTFCCNERGVPLVTQLLEGTLVILFKTSSVYVLVHVLAEVWQAAEADLRNIADRLRRYFLSLLVALIVGAVGLVSFQDRMEPTCRDIRSIPPDQAVFEKPTVSTFGLILVEASMPIVIIVAVPFTLYWRLTKRGL